MAGNTTGRAQYTVACSCGANMTLDARAFGRPKPCKSCGATVTVAWGRDPRSRQTVPVAMTKSPARPKAPAAASKAAAPAPSAAAPAPPEDKLKALCGCGNSKRVPASQKNNPPRCVCGKLMRIEDAPIDRPKGKIEKFERAKPSAPLLPLHLRAPLRARVKKGAQFFDCVCGERVLIRAGSEGRPIQCLNCDRFHTLEIDGPPPPGPAPVPGAAPRGAVAPPTRPLTLGEFVCQCGEIQPPRTSRTGKTFDCKKCGRKGNVEIDKDPQTGTVKMKPVFTSGPTAAPPPAAGPKSAGAPSPATPAGSPAWNCTCGRAIEAHIVLSKSDASCPGCGRRIKLEKWRHPHSTMTMIRPVFGEAMPVVKPGVKATQKPLAKPAAKPVDELVSFEELAPMELDAPQAAPEQAVSEPAVFELAAGSDEGDAPPPVDADAQIAPCECGAEILLSVNDVGHTIQCPACADTMVVEQAGKQITLRTLGALDDPDWKLEEFQ